MFNNRQKSQRVVGGGFQRLTHGYQDIISLPNLLLAWQEFRKRKRNKKDVQEFELHLMDNIFSLHENLKEKTYVHGGYYAFNISDPKPRNIHKASVRDRLLHHVVYRILYPYFDTKFIYDSYSCRNRKGTHRAMNRFRSFAWKVSRNNTRTCFVLKCDIRKFFASIDHKILLEILARYIPDGDIFRLLERIIESFSSTSSGKGLPLGNLTSQLLVNIYMNEFDQFMKHEIKAKYYIRYADDFVFLSSSKSYLLRVLPKVQAFLSEKLKLSLHPEKVYIKTIASGIDFLGWVHFPNHRVLRTTTKRRMIQRTTGLEKDNPTIQSYLGLLEHGNTEKVKQKILKQD